ncbi:MAG: hypothetical protein KTQ12_03620 [Dermatophilaceae bacterium]|nr:hypothetical protein [Dermatophilaceae bacterium]
MGRRADCVRCGATAEECKQSLIAGRGPCCVSADGSDLMREFHPMLPDEETDADPE